MPRPPISMERGVLHCMCSFAMLTDAACRRLQKVTILQNAVYSRARACE